MLPTDKSFRCYEVVAPTNCKCCVAVKAARSVKVARSGKSSLHLWIDRGATVMFPLLLLVCLLLLRIILCRSQHGAVPCGVLLLVRTAAADCFSCSEFAFLNQANASRMVSALLTVKAPPSSRLRTLTTWSSASSAYLRLRTPRPLSVRSSSTSKALAN